MVKSKLVLGTVQLGMPYGVRNAPRPTRNEAFAILDEAYKSGINTFDTAFSYGEAEDVLGAWIEQRGLAQSVYVVTKMRAGALDASEPAEEVIKRELEASLKRLRLSSVDGYLLHAPESMYEEDVRGGLSRVKREGLTRQVGVSIYDEKEALFAAENNMDHIQVPYNVLDQRLDKTNFFEVAAKNNATIFARSPLLQGLLVMKPEEIPPHLSAARQYIERFQGFAREAGLSSLAAAFQYVYCRPQVHHVVFGVQTVEQLREIIASVGESQEAQWMTEARDAFADTPREVVNPRLWDTSHY